MILADLEVQPEYLPEWYRPQFPARLPLPEQAPAPVGGTVIVRGRACGRSVDLLAAGPGGVACAFDWARWTDDVRCERFWPVRRPAYTWLPLHYHHVPAGLRNAAARFLLRGRRGPGGWSPIEQGLELLHAVRARAAGQPCGATPGQVLLTHDIDSAAGFAWIPRIASLEMEHGRRSLWNVVANLYDIDFAVLDWLVDQGFDIGLHGDNHDGRLIFCSEAGVRRRLQACEKLIQRYGARHFRSPAWLRNETLYAVLGEFADCDYSALDSDGFCPGGTRGCLWTRPFARRGVTVFPTTLPVDELLLLGYSTAELLAVWLDKIDWLQGCGGWAVVNTHPDPHRSGNPAMLEVYAALLERLAGFDTARQVAPNREYALA